MARCPICKGEGEVDTGLEKGPVRCHACGGSGRREDWS